MNTKELLDAQLSASIQFEGIKPRPSAIETLVKLYTARIEDLEDQLEYEKLKADAYRMVWSAREYLYYTPGDSPTIHTYRILTDVLNTLEFERVNGVAIRDKYKAQPNPKVVKLIKCSCCERDDDKDGNCDIHSAPGVYRLRETFKSPVLEAKYGRGGSPDTGVLMDPESTIDDGSESLNNWHRRPKC
jgi:hypothetical protein